MYDVYTHMYTYTCMIYTHTHISQSRQKTTKCLHKWNIGSSSKNNGMVLNCLYLGTGSHGSVVSFCKWNVAIFIHIQGTHLSCEPNLSGAHSVNNLSVFLSHTWCFFPAFSPSLSLPLKVNKLKVIFIWYFSRLSANGTY